MINPSPKFRRAPASQRKESLISATLALISEQGIERATVREIAKRAEVTQGLIRHYFSSKEDLIVAAYEFHMSRMTELTVGFADAGKMSARARLAAFVAGGLRPPVLYPKAVMLWAGFLNMVRSDARMQDIHARTYRDFRDRLEQLIAAALVEVGCEVDASTLRHFAVASNAVMDGLWMEGGALPEEFTPDELPKIGLASIGAIIGLELHVGEEQP